MGTLIQIGPNDRFCGYQLESNGAPRLVEEPELAALESRLRALDSSVAVELSCPVVVPLQAADVSTPPSSSKVVQNRARDFDNYFSAQLPKTGSVRALAAETSVRVAVIDTAGVAYEKYDRTRAVGACAGGACADHSPHGRAVGRAIARLLCLNPDSCPSIVNYLALPVVSKNDDRDLQRGGSKGDLRDLAAAIQNALDDWEKIPEAGRPRLILNLSVGWHPVHNRVEAMNLRRVHPQQFYSNPERASLGSSLVRAVIERARCAGALVIAAAGNAIGPDRLMPLYPAGWEAVPVPTAKECSDRGFAVRDPSSLTGNDPLVYAATAVDQYGAPLGTTRQAPPNSTLPGGMAARAALGYAVVTKDPREIGGYTRMYSGTSMAAAVVSGIAARTWLAAPGSSARQIMARLPRGVCGIDTERAPDLCVGRGPGRPGCGAHYEIIGGRAEGCESVPRPAPAARSGTPPCATPGARGCRSSRGTAYYLFEPWVHPQPGEPECVNCSAVWSPARWNVNVLVRPTVRPTVVTFYGRNSPLTWAATYNLGEVGSGTFEFQPPVTPREEPITPVQAFISTVVTGEEDPTRSVEMEEMVPLIQRSDESP